MSIASPENRARIPEERPEPGVHTYDNFPLNGRSSHPSESMHKWQIPIEHVDRKLRDERILEGPVEYILEACGKYPPLKEHMVKKLVVSFQETGDLEAREKLILHNLGLVVHIGKQVRDNQDINYQDFADLLQDGIFGLNRAIEKYDVDHPSKAKFSTYAGYWIANSMGKGSANSDRTIRIPIHIKERSRNVGRNFFKLQAALRRKPSLQEISDEIGISVEEVEETIVRTKKPLSLDEFIGKDSDDEWMSRQNVLKSDANSVFDTVSTAVDKLYLSQIMQGLSYKESRVLEIHHGLYGESPRTLREIANIFNVSSQRISQIEQRAFVKIKNINNIKKFDESPARMTPEEQELRRQRANKRPHKDFTEYIATDARNNTNNIEEIQREKEDRRRAEKEEAELQKRQQQIEIENNAMVLQAQSQANEEFEKMVMEKAIFAPLYETGGQLPLRKLYLLDRGFMEPAVLNIEEKSDTYKFLQLYGHFASKIHDELLQALKGMTEDNEHWFSMTQIEAQALEESDLLFEIRPEFINAVLVASERLGYIKSSVLLHENKGYVYRIADVETVEQSSEQPATTMRRHKYKHPENYRLANSIEQLQDAMKKLGIGSDERTSITFGQLRAQWAQDNPLDVDEVQLRQAMAYLVKSGLVETKSSNRVGQKLWAPKRPNFKNVTVKPHELWFEN